MPREKEKDRQRNGQEKKRRTDNAMAKRKREGQTTQWPKDRQHNGQKTDTTMAKRKSTIGQTTIYKTYT
jgi:hypothetical protein